jgi:uncharacterized protein YfiM (DUF2279 family)
MTEAVEFKLGDGDASVLVDVDPVEGGQVMRATNAAGAVSQALSTFDAGFARVRTAASAALAQLSSMPQRPDTVELEFGVRISAEAGAVIARSAVDGHLKVRVVWDRSRPNGSHVAEEKAEDDPEESTEQQRED